MGRGLLGQQNPCKSSGEKSERVAKVIKDILKRGAQFPPPLCINTRRTSRATDAECSRANGLANDAVENDRMNCKGDVCSFQDGVLRWWCTRGMFSDAFNWKSAIKHVVVFKIHDVVASVRYSSVCNVLRQ